MLQAGRRDRRRPALADRNATAPPQAATMEGTPPRLQPVARIRRPAGAALRSGHFAGPGLPIVTACHRMGRTLADGHAPEPEESRAERC